MLAMHALSTSGDHVLTADAAAAEIIVLAGDFEAYAEVCGNALLRQYPERTFAYSEIDAMVPYVPGVYGSAAKPRGLNLHRTQSNIYLSRYASSMNPEIRYRPDEAKRWLFCFRGRRDCRVRADLISYNYRRPDVQVLETSGYMHWKQGVVGEEQAQKNYADMLAQSHFALCPRGMGHGSIRLFEVMEMGVAPVLLADQYALPPGPDWSAFLIQVPERQFAHLPEILDPRTSESRQRGELARYAWEQHFAPPVIFDRIVDQIRTIRESRKISERAYRRLWPLLAFRVNMRQQLTALLSRKKV